MPDQTLSLRGGAILPWSKTGSTSPYYTQTLEALAKHYKQPMTKAWKDLPEDFRNAVLFGTGKTKVQFVYDDGTRSYKTEKPFEGVVGNIERRWRETDSQMVRDELSRYQSDHACDACNGYRLKPEALCVKIADRHIGEITALSIKTAHDWFSSIDEKLTDKQNEIAYRILKEIRERLKFLNDVGLEYLSMSRSSGTLSGGESSVFASLPDRFRPDRCFVCARRAFHRPASTRQCPPAGNPETPA